MTKKMKYAVLGYTQSGKTTVGNLIAKATGGKSASISDYLKSMAHDSLGIPSVIWACMIVPVIGPFLRMVLFVFGRGLEHADPLYVIRKMLEDGVTVVCGMRTIDELEAVCKEKLFDEIWWVDKGISPGDTDALGVDSLFGPSLLCKKVNCRIIDNTGILDSLRAEVMRALGKESK